MFSVAPAIDITLIKTHFECQIPSLDYSGDVWPNLQADPPIHHGRGGVFYIQDANIVTSNNNSYHKCYLSPRGGVFSLFNTASMTD